MKRLHLFLLTSSISVSVVELFHLNILLNGATDCTNHWQPRHYCEDNEGDLIMMSDYWLGLTYSPYRNRK